METVINSRGARVGDVMDLLWKKPQLIILVLMSVALAITTPQFSSPANLMNLLRQVSVIAIISCGLTLVVISGALDLSVGSTLSLLNVISATLQLKNDAAAVFVPLVFGIVVGLFNGSIVTLFKVNSIIVTLGSLSVVSGIALMYTNGAIIIGKTGTWYSSISQGEFLGIPYHVAIFIAVAVVLQLVLQRTKFGRALRYVGTNIEAAKIAGISVRKVQLIAFMLTGLCVAISAIVLSSRMNSGTPVAGVGFEFDAITAIVIGGTSLAGGKGSILSTIIGVLLLAVIINALTLYNVPYAFQNIMKGLLIIVSVVADVKQRQSYGK